MDAVPKIFSLKLICLKYKWISTPKIKRLFSKASVDISGWMRKR